MKRPHNGAKARRENTHARPGRRKRASAKRRRKRDERGRRHAHGIHPDHPRAKWRAENEETEDHTS